LKDSRRISLLLILAGLFLWLAAYLLLSENPWNSAKEMALIEAGKSVKLEFQVALGMYLAAAVNLVLCTGLLVAWYFFDCQLAEPSRGITGNEMYGAAGDSGMSGMTTRAFYLGLLLIVLTGGALRWNLASRSLWWDELWTVKNAVVGAYVPDKEDQGALKFKEVSWERSAWYYRKPTNHAVASLSSKLVDTVWRSFSKAQPHEFHDIVIRLPMLLCGLASIFMVGLLGRRWGMSWAGLAAAALLAVHPWHIRYGVDARAYTFVVLWAAMGCFWLTFIVRQTNRSVFPWLMFGVNQFLLVWSFPQTLWLAIGFFLSAVMLIFVSWRGKQDRLTALWSLVLVNTLAGMLFLQMFAPNLIQMWVWMKADASRHEGHELTGTRFQEFLTQSFFGMPPHLSSEGDAAGLPSFFGQLHEHPIWMWLAMILLGLATLVGGFYVAYTRHRVSLILAGVLMGGLLALAFYGMVDTYFYHRFMIFLLVLIVFLPAFFLQWLADSLGWRSKMTPGVSVLMVMLALYVGVVWPQMKVLNERSYAPLREVAVFFQKARGGVFSDPEGDRTKIIATVYGHGGEQLHVYDPEVKVLRSLDELKAMAKIANESGARLLVAYDHRQFNKAIVPDGFEWLDDESRFREMATYPAIEPEFFFRILEYTGK